MKEITILKMLHYTRINKTQQKISALAKGVVLPILGNCPVNDEVEVEEATKSVYIHDCNLGSLNKTQKEIRHFFQSFCSPGWLHVQSSHGEGKTS